MRAWLTGDDATPASDAVCIRIPTDAALRAAFRGAVLLLMDAANWEDFGDASAADCAAAFAPTFDDLVSGAPCGPTGGDSAVVGEIILAAFASAPTGFLACDGAYVDPEDYPALFGAIGYTWGRSGDLFAVPDMRGRVPVGCGTGSGLTTRALADSDGQETVVLTENQMPSHAHRLSSLTYVPAASGSGAYGVGAGSGIYTSTTGGNQAHVNMQPFAVIQYFIRAEAD